MDHFFTQVEERENPHFQGKPIVVGAEPNEGKGRGVVSTANYKARKYGIHSALPISQAYKLCPEAIFLPVNGALYGKVSKRIFDMVRQKVLIVEQVSVDEAYLDVSHLSWEEAEVLAKELKQKIWKTEQLTCTCGIGPSKMIAKMVCEKAKPDGIGIVKEEETESFVENLQIENMPGIGKKTATMLRTSNLDTIAKLKKLSEHKMEELFGKRGKEMYQRVRGKDQATIVTEREIKSIGKEHTFGKDTRDPEILIRVFEQLSHEVAHDLKEQNFLCKTVTVVCRFQGFETHTKAKTFAQASNDFNVLRVEAMKLFLKFIVSNPKPIRLVGLRVTIGKS